MSRSNSFQFSVIFLTGLLTLAVSSQSLAATLTSGDLTGTTSFNAALHWNPNAAPSAGNSYFTGAFTLRTPQSVGDFTFGGGSLSLDAGGTLAMKGSSAGSGGGTITINNFTFNGGNVGNFQAPNAFVLSGSNMRVTLTSSLTLGQTSGAITVGSPISGAVGANLNITGSSLGAVGWIGYSAANTYFGDTNLLNYTMLLTNTGAMQNSTLKVSSGGTLAVGTGIASLLIGGLSDPNSGSAGNISLSNTAAVAMAVSVGNNNTSTSYSGALTGAGSLNKVGTGVLSLLGSSTFTGGTTIGSGTLQLGNGIATGSISGSIADNATLQFNQGGSYTQSGNISGTGNVTKLGGGTAILSGSNTNSGTVTISGGTLQLGNGGANGNLGGSIVNNSTLVYNVGGSDTQLGNISGSGILIKSGSGTVTLAGNATYSGSTAINAGTLNINGNNATSVISVAAAGTLAGSGTANTVSVVSGGTVAGGSGGIGSLTLASLIYGGSGAVNISNIANYSSVAALNVTGNNALTLNGAVGSVPLVLSGTAPSGSGTAHLVQYAGALQGTGYNAFTLNSSGVAFGARAVLSLTNTNAGFIDLNYTVDHPVWSGLGDGSWSLTPQSPQNWTLAVAGTATDFLTNDAVTFDNSAAGTGTLTVSITAANVAPSAVTFNNDGKNYLVQGAFGITGGASVSKTGSGTVTLANANSYTGGTTLNNGVLAFASSGLGTSGNITLSGTSTLQFVSGNTQDVSSRLVLANGAAATINIQGGSVTFAGNVGGGSSAGLTKAGTGTLVFASSNSYTGGTTIQAGVLQLGSAAASVGVSSSPVTMSGGALDLAGNSPTIGALGGSSGLVENTTGRSVLTVNSAADSSYSGNLASVGGVLALTKAGPASLTLLGANSYSDSTTITGGTLKIGVLAAYPAGGLLTVSGGTMDVGGFNITTGAVTLTSGAINNGSLNATDYGVVAGSVGANLGGNGAALTKTGASLVTLSGSNTYGGATTVSAGTLAVAANNSLPATTVLTLNANGANFSMPGVSQTLAGVQGIISNSNGTVNVLGNANSQLIVGPTATSFNVGCAATGSTSGQTVTLNMSTIGTFSYTNTSASGRFDAGPQFASGQTGNDAGVITLAGTNTITVAQVSTFGTYEAAGITTASQSAIHLGATNTINTNAVLIPNTARSTSLFDFQAGGSSLKLRATDGTSAVANVTIGSGAGGSSAQTNATVTLTNGTTDALIGSLLIGNMNQSNNNSNSNTALFQMGAGTLSAATITLGQMTPSTGSLSIQNATLSLSNSGTILAGTMTLGSYALAITNTVNSTFNLNSGTLLAGTLQSGAAGGGTVTRNFNWTTGAIGNAPGTSLTVSGLTLTMTSAGVHTLYSDAGQSATFASTTVLAGTGNLNIGGGRVTLGGNNTFSGSTSVSSGILSLTGVGQINTSSAIAINGGSLLQDSSVAATPAIALNQGTLGGIGSVGGVTVASSTGAIVQGGDANAGTLSINSLTFNGAGQVKVVLGSSLVQATSLTANGAAGSVTINISGPPPTTIGETQLVLYSGAIGGTGSSAFTLGSLPTPPRYTASLDFSNAGVIDLNVTFVDRPVWSGSQSSEWSTNAISGAKNWVLAVAGTATDFLPGDNVVFNDSAASGIVAISGTADVAPSSVVFNNSSLLSYAIGGPHGIVDSLNGPTAVALTGSGLVKITNSNGYTGGTMIGGGTLQIGDGGSSGSITGNIANNGLLLFSRSDNITQAGNISGNGSITQVGSGMLTLSGSNTYSGGATITAGTLQTFGSNAASTGPIAVGAAAALFLNSNGGTVTYSNSIGGAGLVLVQPGTGSTSSILTGNLGGFNGTIEVLGPGGKMALTNPAATTPDPAATIKVDSGATLYLNNVAVASAIRLSGGTTGEALGQLRLDTNASTSGPIALLANTTIGSFSGTGTINGAISDSGAGFSFTKLGTGTIVLTGSNTYSGGTTISAGAVNINSDAALGQDVGGLTFSANSTLQFGNAIALPSARSLVIGSGVTATFDTRALSGTTSIAGVISGSGALTKTASSSASNPSPLLLSGSNTFTGNVTISVGNLFITNGSALGVGTKTIAITNGTAGNPQLHLNPGAGGVIDLPTTFTYTVSNTSPTEILDPTQGTIVNESGNNILRGNITNTSGGGGLVLTSNSGSITFLGNDTPTATSRVLVLRGNGSGTFSGSVLNGSTTSGLPIYKDSGSGTWTLGSANTNTGLTAIQAGALSVSLLANGGVPSNIGASTNAAANLILGGGALQYTGTGATTDRLFTVTPAGGTIDASGATNGALVFNNGGAIVSSDAIAHIGTESTTSNPTIILFTGVGTTTDLVLGMSVSGSGIPANTTITAVGPASITLSNSATASQSDTLTFGVVNRTLTLTGTSADGNQMIDVLADSAGGGKLSVAKAGPGFWNLGAANGYSGGTTVGGGTLQLGNATALGSGGLTDNAGVLDLNANSIGVPSFKGIAGTVTNSGTSNVTLTVNQAASTTFGGALTNGPTNNLALSLTGTGKLVLSGSSNFSGGTIVNGGTLVLAINNSIPDGTNVTINTGGTLIFDVNPAPAPIAVDALIPSGGAIAVPEPGTLVLLIAGALAALAAQVRRKKYAEFP